MTRSCAGCLLLTAFAVLCLSYSSARGQDAKNRKSPILYTQKSIDQGKAIFLANCTGCHGQDGKAETAVIAEATNLTQPDLYLNGVTEGEIFSSVWDGAGQQMPPFRFQLGDEQEAWLLVNFVRSLWPESERPKLVEQ